jgi:hypothetical protein
VPPDAHLALHPESAIGQCPAIDHDDDPKRAHLSHRTRVCSHAWGGVNTDEQALISLKWIDGR